MQGKDYLEYELARAVRRLKNIKENPDPTKPKSNILLYECDRDFRQEQLDALKSGKPFAYVHHNMTRAMGFVPWDGVRAADRSYGERARKYFDIIRQEGMAEHTCDRTIMLIPMVLRGDFPRPDFLMITNRECLPIYLAFKLVATLKNVPHFFIDRKFESYARRESEVDLKYVTDQLGEMIEYAEAKVPGCKYDEDKLIEMQYYNREYMKHDRELWKLRANIPCPVSGRESFRELTLPSQYPDPAKIVEWMRQYVEEIGEKVAKGQSALPDGGEEKLRLLWSISGPFFADPFSWLEKRGVSIPAAEMTVYNSWRSGRSPIWGDPWKGRKATPLEEEARELDYLWGRLGKNWIQTNLDSCRDLKLDGIVYFMQWGCSVTNGLGQMMAEMSEKELGIPTLLIEGRMLDESVFDKKDFFDRLEEFLGICKEAKKRRTSAASVE